MAATLSLLYCSVLVVDVGAGRLNEPRLPIKKGFPGKSRIYMIVNHFPLEVDAMSWCPCWRDINTKLLESVM
uniref:Uncharacterized protein n=1 Tax=Kalanchoe fedtschenkoi TaxID=63787 RepID=A0A7N0VLK8_KALFE